MSLFQDAAAGGLDSIRQAAGVTVTIRRGGIASAPVVAGKGTSDFVQETDDGSSASWRTDDYLIAVADYAIEGVAVKPEPGDQIEETLGTESAVSEVIKNGGEPCWRYSDRGQRQYRIHTQRISE